MITTRLACSMEIYGGPNRTFLRSDAPPIRHFIRRSAGCRPAKGCPRRPIPFRLGNCRRRTGRFGLELSTSAMGRLLGPPIARHWENMSRTQYTEARLGPLHKQRHLSSGYSTFTLSVVPRCPNLSIVSNYCNLASASIFVAANGVIDWLSAISSTSHSFSLNKPTLTLTSCRS